MIKITRHNSELTGIGSESAHSVTSTICQSFNPGLLTTGRSVERDCPPFVHSKVVTAQIFLSDGDTEEYAIKLGFSRDAVVMRANVLEV